MEEKPDIKLESKIDWQIKQGSGLGFAGLGPRQVGVGAAAAWLGFAGLGPRQVAVRAGQMGQSGQGSGVDRGRRGSAWLCWAECEAGAAGAWLGFAGLGPRQVAVRAGQVGQVGHVRRLAGFAGAVEQAGAVRAGGVGRQAGLAWQVGQVGAAGAWLVFAGLGPRQVGAAGAQLGFAGLGPRHTAVRGGWGRQWQPGLGSALLSWVLGRQAGRYGVRQVGRQAGRLGCSAGRQAGRQARAGRQGRLAGRQGRGTQSRAGGVGRQAGLAWQVGQVGAAGAWLVFAGLGPRQVGAAGARLGFAGLGPRHTAVRGGWGRQWQPGLGSALLSWVLGRQAGRYGVRQVGRKAWLVGRQAGRQVGRLAGRQAGSVGRQLSRQAGWSAGQAGRQAGRAGRQAGRAGRQAGRADWQAGRQTGRLVGRAGRQVGWRAVAARAPLGFAGLGPRQVGQQAGRYEVRQVGRQAWLVGSSAGRQVSRQAGRLGWAGSQASRQGRSASRQAGRLTGRLVGGAGGAVRGSLALLGWVLRRWQSGWVGRQGRAAGAWLGFAGLGPSQVGFRLAGLAGQFGLAGAAGAAGAWLGSAGLGPRQAGRAGQRGTFENQNSQLTFSLKVFNFFGLKKLAKTLEANNCIVVEEDGDEDKFSDSDLIAEFNGKNSDTFVPALLVKVWLRYWELVVSMTECCGRAVGVVRMSRLGRWGRLVGKGRADQLVAGSAWLGQVGPNPNPASFAILVYSDRLVHSGHAGAGPYLVQKNREVSCHLGPAGEITIFECELVGILLGLKLMIALPPIERHGLGVIYVDSKSTLSRLKNPFSSKPGQHLVLEILYLLLANILLPKIMLAWRPGHKDIKGNERLDNIAKREAWNPAMDSLEAIKARTKFVADSPR
ncbi:hypothetical protein BY996DRAFT_6566607 [Phakopsora pachyrhizi]|nr:hypothetical protein BY996DRAFT_6566607 [Phakopsora pachyrhizi]